MPVLRGHHLICLHFFHGEGYDETFVRNLKEILKKVKQKNLLVADGVDDVCRFCPHLRNNRCEYKEGADEKVREMDDVALRLLSTKKDEKLRWDEIRERIPKIFSFWHTNYCYGCDWLMTCKKNKFYQTLKINL